ncbi:MAG: HgcAB-associated protein HgcC, partial [Syntrophobacteraceae bacterium]
MAKKNKGESCCASDTKETCCTVESLITVDERGQMVLPK